MKDCKSTEVYYGTQKSNVYYRVPKNISLLIMYVSIKMGKMPVEVEKERWLDYKRIDCPMPFDELISVTNLSKYKVEYEDDHFLMLEFTQDNESFDEDGGPAHTRYKVRSAVIKVKNRNRDGMTMIDLDITDELKEKLIEWQEE